MIPFRFWAVGHVPPDGGTLEPEPDSQSPCGPMDALQARPIAVPPFTRRYLHRGHAVRFRAAHPEAAGFRIDVMSGMRGVDPFPHGC